jgi:hypothetical protein
MLSDYPLMDSHPLIDGQTGVYNCMNSKEE